MPSASASAVWTTWSAPAVGAPASDTVSETVFSTTQASTELTRNRTLYCPGALGPAIRTARRTVWPGTRVSGNGAVTAAPTGSPSVPRTVEHTLLADGPSRNSGSVPVFVRRTATRRRLGAIVSGDVVSIAALNTGSIDSRCTTHSTCSENAVAHSCGVNVA